MQRKQKWDIYQQAKYGRSLENGKSDLLHLSDNKQGQLMKYISKTVVGIQKPERKRRGKKVSELEGKIFSRLKIMRNLSGKKHPGVRWRRQGNG